MANYARYGAETIEWAKSEVSMRISVKFWLMTDEDGSSYDNFRYNSTIGYMT